MSYNRNTFPKKQGWVDTIGNRVYFEFVAHQNKVEFTLKKRPHNEFPTIGDVLNLQQKDRTCVVRIDEEQIQQTEYQEKEFTKSRACRRYMGTLL